MKRTKKPVRIRKIKPIRKSELKIIKDKIAPDNWVDWDAILQR